MFTIDITASKIVWVLAALFGIYAIYWLIRNLKDPYYSSAIKTILVILRTVAILIFIIIFLDIKITFVRDRQVKPEIAFLWDLSQSMNHVGDEDFSVTDILRSSSYREIDRQTSIYHITNMQNPRIVTEAQLRSLPVDEVISDNSKLIKFAEKQARFHELVLISDGRSYIGESLGSIKLSDKLTLHTIGVGNKTKKELLQLRSVRFPDHVLQGDSIAVNWSLENPSDESIQTRLIINNVKENVFEQDVVIPAHGMMIYKKTFSPLPEGPSTWTWSLEKENKRNEIGSENLYVHSSAIRIVIHANPPSQDISMLTTVLSTLERIEVFKDKEWKIAFPDEKPDLLIQTWHPLTEPKIYQNIPSILLYRDLENSYQTSGELSIVGLQPYLNFNPDPITNARFWKSLPPIQVANYKGEGSVIMKTEQGRPVILENTKDQSLLITASGLWRWNLAGFEKDWDGIYKHLITGMINNQIRRGGKSYIALDDKIYSGIAYQPFNVGIEHYHFELLDQSETSVRVSLLDSNYQEIYRKELNTPSEKVTSFILKEAGEYFVEAEIFTHDLLLESDTAKILINENDMEDRYKSCDADLLKRVAMRHGGHYVQIDDLDSLKYFISTDKTWKPLTHLMIARKAYFLYVLMFLMLCIDWILRKRNGGM